MTLVTVHGVLSNFSESDTELSFYLTTTAKIQKLLKKVIARYISGSRLGLLY